MNTYYYGVVPKNIRQIGRNDANEKVYLEDYVITYIRQVYKKNKDKILVLVGHKEIINNITYSFINGVLEIKKSIKNYSDLLLNENIIKITKDKEDFFEGQDFMGICVVINNEWESFNHEITECFASGVLGEIVLVEDALEEERVYSFKNNVFVKEKGYYIYYDRNEQMQNYMLYIKDGTSIEYGYSQNEVLENSISNMRTFTIPKNTVYTSRGLDGLKYKKFMESKINGKVKNIIALGCVVFALMFIVTKMNDVEKVTKKKVKELYGNTVKQIEEDNKHGNRGESETEVETIVGNIQIKPKETREEEHIDKSKATENKLNTSDTTKIIDEIKQKTSIVNKKEAKKKIYIVKRGDVLVEISKKIYGTHKKVGEIKKINKIVNEDKIFIGQRLMMP